MVTLTANVSGQDLNRVSGQLDEAIQRAGVPPRSVKVNVRGQVGPMKQTLSSLGVGLLLAVLVIFLLLAANFQSMKLAFVVLSTIPAVVCGVIFILLITGTTLNVQSFMEPSWPSGLPLRTPFCLSFSPRSTAGQGILQVWPRSTERKLA